MFTQVKKQLETMVIIKISSYPCQFTLILATQETLTDLSLEWSKKVKMTDSKNRDFQNHQFSKFFCENYMIGPWISNID